MKTIIDRTEINENLKNKINLIVISDIHDDNKEKRITQYEKTINIIKKHKPDYILIPGDTIQSENFSRKNITNFIKNLGKICPTILSLGNHELHAEKKGTTREWYTNLNNYKNIYALDNNSITIKNIQFLGFNPSLKTYTNRIQKKANNNFIEEYQRSNISLKKDNKYNIMLCHSPLFITKEVLDETNLNNINLFVCGHMHNGLTPKILEKKLKEKGLFGPAYNIFPKRCRGIIQLNNSKIFISKGYRKLTIENKLLNHIDEKIFKSNIHEIIIK